MTVSPDVSTAEDHFAIGFLTMSYLVGQRNDVLALSLSEVVGPETTRRVSSIVARLSSPRREERSGALQTGMGVVLGALRRRAWEPKR